MLFCHVTTRVEGDKYPTLLKEKGGTGFPYLVFMDAEGNVLAKQGDRSVAGFQKTLESCKSYIALDAKQKAGDKTVAADLLIARIELGQIEHAEAQQQLAALGKIDAQKQKTIDGLMVNLEVMSMLQGARTQDGAKEVGAKFAEMMKAGRAPTGAAARNFYSMILIASEAAVDAATYERALEGLKGTIGDSPGAKKAMERFEQTLAKLKAGGEPKK